MKRAALPALLLLTSACAPSPLGPIQICSVDNFNAEASKCPSDERQLNAGGVVCSLLVEGRKGQKASGKYFYKGEEVLTFDDEITGDTGTITFRFARVGLALLPGGDWSCELTVGGETLNATFASTAPEGPILDAAVCPTADALEDDSGICAQDESASGFADTDVVTCSASVAGGKGKLVRTSLYRGTNLIGSSHGVTPDIQLSAYSKSFHSVDEAGFGAGDYSCTFLVDDEVAAERSFHINAR